MESIAEGIRAVCENITNGKWGQSRLRKVRFLETRSDQNFLLFRIFLISLLAAIGIAAFGADDDLSGIRLSVRDAELVLERTQAYQDWKGRGWCPGSTPIHVDDRVVSFHVRGRCMESAGSSTIGQYSVQRLTGAVEGFEIQGMTAEEKRHVTDLFRYRSSRLLTESEATCLVRGTSEYRNIDRSGSCPKIVITRDRVRSVPSFLISVASTCAKGVPTRSSLFVADREQLTIRSSLDEYSKDDDEVVKRRKLMVRKREAELMTIDDAARLAESAPPYRAELERRTCPVVIEVGSWHSSEAFWFRVRTGCQPSVFDFGTIVVVNRRSGEVENPARQERFQTSGLEARRREIFESHQRELGLIEEELGTICVAK